MLPSVFRNTKSLLQAVAASALLFTLSVPSVAAAQTYTFEGLGYTGCQPNAGPAIGTVGDKEWAGFRALDLVDFKTTCGYGSNNGYGLLGASVGNVIALGAGPAYVHSVNPFVLNGMVAGAGWQNPTALLLDFYLGGVLKSSKNIQLTTDQTGLSRFTGFYAGATDFIMFTPTYPPDDAAHTSDVFKSYLNYCPNPGQTCVDQRYKSWFVDNLDFSPAVVDPLVAPEPGTVGMIALGLLAVGFAGRKRRQA